jgi:glycerophosphoryl diester phosphodiesterase
MVEISGHRGCRSPHIENTATAFRYCIEHKIDWIEFDVKKTKDQQLVVFHDYRIDKLLNGKGPLESFTLDQLRKFNYKDGQTILTLEEFFELIDHKIKPMLEIKSRGIAKPVMKLVNQFGYEESEIIVQSFIGKDILDCYKLDPRPIYGKCLSVLGKSSIAKTLGLQKGIAKIMYARLVEKFPVTWLNIDGPFAYDEFMQLAKNNNKKIILGAMQTEKYLPKLAEWNISIVNCDDPVRIKRILETEK